MNNNFKTFDNPYAVMAQGAYPKSPRQFPINKLPSEQRQILKSGQSIEFDFKVPVTQNGVTYPGGKYYSANPSDTKHPDWPKDGVVYLQPDPKGRMSDPLTGFNAYYLTDTPQVDGTTKQTAKEEITMRA